MIKKSELGSNVEGASADADRRELLLKYGRFALITPAAVTLMLANPLTSKAIAASGGSYDAPPPPPPASPPPPPPPPPASPPPQLKQTN